MKKMNKGESLFKRLYWSPRTSICGLLTLLIFSIAALTGFEINTHPYLYYPQDDETLVFEKQLREHFRSDQIIVALFEPEDIYADDFLIRLDALVDDLEAHPLVDEVDSITRSDHIVPDSEGFSIDPIIDVQSLEETSRDERHSRVINNHIAPRLLAAEDGSATSLIITPTTNDTSMTRLELDKFFHDTVEKHQLKDDLKSVSGPLTVDVAVYNSVMQDSMKFIPAVAALGLFLIWWLFRSGFATFLSWIAMNLTMTFTVALYGVIGTPYTAISNMIAPIISALTVALLIHFFSAMTRASQLGLTGRPRVEHAVSSIFRPAFFASLTTALGFLSLTLSPVPPTRALGLVTGIGVAMIFVIVVGLLPALVLRWDRGEWKKSSLGLKFIDQFLFRAVRISVRYPLAVVSAFVVACIGLAPIIKTLNIETNFLEYFHSSHPIVQSTRHIQDRMSGTTQLDVVFEAQSPDTFTNLDVVKYIDQFQTWAEGLKEIDLTFSYVDYVHEMHKAFTHTESENAPEHRGDKGSVALTSPMVSQYFLLNSGTDLYNLIDRNRTRARVAMSLNVHGSNEIRDVIERLNAHLSANPPPGAEWRVAGYGNIFANQIEMLVKGQLNSIWGAFILIFGCLLIAWRSFTIAFLAMIPNLAPVFLAFIAMAIAGVPLDFSTVLMASIVVGIAVDDTIHIFDGYSNRMRNGAAPVAALLRTYRNAGRAVTATTFVLCSQYLVFLLSDMVPVSNFGIVSAVGLGSALFFDIMLLPAILVLKDRRKQRDRLRSKMGSPETKQAA